MELEKLNLEEVVILTREELLTVQGGSQPTTVRTHSQYGTGTDIDDD